MGFTRFEAVGPQRPALGGVGPSGGGGLGGGGGGIGIGDDNGDVPLWKFHEHTAAVKALAWDPHVTGVLATGGGTADKHIRFWNVLNGNMLHELDTGSQVRFTSCFMSDLEGIDTDSCVESTHNLLRYRFAT